MRQFMFDEIRREDMEKMTQWLEERAENSPMTGLYWMTIPDDLLDPGQLGERDDQPFCFAIELGDDWAKFELLVRSRTNLRSPHTRYATPRQMQYIIDMADQIVQELQILT